MFLLDRSFIMGYLLYFLPSKMFGNLNISLLKLCPHSLCNFLPIILSLSLESINGNPFLVYFILCLSEFLGNLIVHFHPPPRTLMWLNPSMILVNGITKPKSTSKEKYDLPTRLLLKLMPNHVAVIMDGNSRWAQMRGLPVGAGYKAGGRAFRGLAKLCCKWGIRVLNYSLCFFS